MATRLRPTGEQQRATQSIERDAVRSRAPTATGSQLPGRLLELQAAVGNRAVARMLARDTSAAATLEDDCCPECLAGDPCGGHAPAGLTSPRFAGDARLEACLQDRARLAPGDRGEAVVKVQQALIDLEYDLGPTGADGDYGKRTAAAVKAFKRAEKLGFEQYGDVGPGTMRRLDDLFPGELPRCPEPIPILDVATETGGPAQGGPMLGFKIPGLHCQIGPTPTPPSPDPKSLADLPPDIRRRIKVRRGTLDQANIDAAFQIWRGSKQVNRISQRKIFVNQPPVIDLTDALESVAWHLLKGITPGLALDETITVLLNNVPGNPSLGKGVAVMQPGGVYRFTRFSPPNATEAVLIELIAPVARATPATAMNSKQVFEAKYANLPYIIDTAYGPAGIAQVDQTLDLIPDTARRAAIDPSHGRLTFFRRDHPPTGEDGEYNPNTGVITIYSQAFNVSADRPGGFSRVHWAVAHELGHALDFKDRRPTPVGAEFDKVTSPKSPDRTPITAYAATDRGEYFAEAFALWVIDPAELRALRPDVFALFQKRYRP